MVPVIAVLLALSNHYLSRTLSGASSHEARPCNLKCPHHLRCPHSHPIRRGPQQAPSALCAPPASTRSVAKRVFKRRLHGDSRLQLRWRCLTSASPHSSICPPSPGTVSASAVLRPIVETVC